MVVENKDKEKNISGDLIKDNANIIYSPKINGKRNKYGNRTTHVVKNMGSYAKYFIGIALMGVKKLGQRSSKLKYVKYAKYNKDYIKNNLSIMKKKNKYGIIYLDSFGDRKKYMFTIHSLCRVIQKNGDKSTAYKLIINVAILLRTVGYSEPLKKVAKAIKIITPHVETRPVKRGGKVLQVPSMIKSSRRRMLAMRWLVESSKHRVAKHQKGYYGFASAIAQEVRAILLDKKLPRNRMKYSEAIYKRNMMHKAAKSNRININIKKKK